jgi:penicillin-insensitive murein endopeptidase
VAAIERAAAAVARARPGGVLAVGDLSARSGGVLMPHLSHRTGRDADLLLYVTTLEGAPVISPGFVHVGPDGLAYDEDNKHFLRFDVEREWLLVKTLVEDDEARIQWLFGNHVIEAMLLEWARASGESVETIWRVEEAMLEPHPGGAHDDHVHVRTACSAEEIAQGCEPSGPARPWIAMPPPPELPSDGELVLAIFRPLDASPPAPPIASAP